MWVIIVRAILPHGQATRIMILSLCLLCVIQFAAQMSYASGVRATELLQGNTESRHSLVSAYYRNIV